MIYLLCFLSQAATATITTSAAHTAIMNTPAPCVQKSDGRPLYAIPAPALVFGSIWEKAKLFVFMAGPTPYAFTGLEAS